MFKTGYTKLPAFLLALLACLVTVYQPVLVIAVAASSTESESESESKSKSSETESETEKLLEAKEFCHRTFSSRRLRQSEHQLLLQSPMAMDQTVKLPVVLEFNPLPKFIYLHSPPLLRAPPA